MASYFLSVLLLFTHTRSIELLEPIDDEFVLDKNEYVNLFLNTYFSGDNLKYSISSSTGNLENVNLTNPSSNANKQILKNVTIMSSSTMATFEVFEDVIGSQIFIYGANHTLTSYILDISLNNKIYSIILANFTGEIMQYQIYKIFEIIVLTYDDYILKYQIFMLRYLSSDLVPPVLIHVPELEGLRDVSISSGSLNDTIMISGYEGNLAKLMIFTITNYTFMLIYEFDYEVQVEFDIPNLLVANYSTHFCYLTFNNKLIKLGEVNDTYYLKGSLLLSEDSYVYSLALYNSKYLIAGTNQGISIIDLNFEQVFNKFIKSDYSYFVAASNTGIFVMGMNSFSTEFYIVEYDFDFNILDSQELTNIKTPFTWIAFCSNYQTIFTLIYSNDTYMNIMEITLSLGVLRFRSGDTEEKYMLSATDYLNQTLVQEFSVTPLKNIMEIKIEKDISWYYLIFIKENASEILNIKNMFEGNYVSINDAKIIYSKEAEGLFNYGTPSITKTSYYQSIASGFFSYYTSIFLTGSSIFLYNSTTILPLNTNLITPLENIYIIQILNCDDIFLVYFQLEYNYYYQLTENLNEIIITTANQTGYCETLVCSLYFFLCQIGNIINVTEIYDEYPVHFGEVNSTILDYDNPQISNFFIFLDLYLFVIVNGTDLAQINLITLPFGSTCLLSKYNFDYKIISGYGSDEQIYLVSDSNSVIIYDFLFSTIRIYDSLPSDSVYFINDYIIVINDNNVALIDGLSLKNSAYIFNRTIDNFKAFSIQQTSVQVEIVFLSENNISSLIIPNNYYSLSLGFEIASANKISEISYNATLTMMIENQDKSSVLEIPLILFVNGQTIYKNESQVDYIQNHLMMYPCNSGSYSIPLSNLFLGQDMNVSIYSEYSGLDQIISINERFREWKNKTLDLEITGFYPVWDQNLFLITVGCNVYVANYTMDFAFYYSIDYESCLCESISTIIEYNEVVFAVGCILYNSEYEQSLPINIILFLSLSQNIISLVNNFTLDFEPSKLSIVSKNNGEFLLAVANQNHKVSFSGFYSNHLFLIHGIANGYDFDIFKTAYVDLTSSKNPSNYFYAIDFSGIYDPMFDTFYYYIVDYYSGLWVLEYQSYTQNYIHNLTITLDIGQISSLAVCGYYLYISLENTTIISYFFEDWKTLSQYNTFYPFNNYTALPGTLSCSNKNYASYLSLVTENYNKSTYFHVIDTQATELSSIITDELLSTNRRSVYASFSNYKNITVLSYEYFRIYTLNQYYLEIDTKQTCENNINLYFTILASNDIANISAKASFSLQISKEYSTGNVDDEIPIWEWVLISFALLTMSIICYMFAKRCLSNKKIKISDRQIFNYDYTFDNLK